VDGWAVHGFSDGTRIGYDWYRTRAEAEKAKAAWEKVETTTGKYYDRVEIRPERRRVYLPPPERKSPPPPSEDTGYVPRPGVGSMPAARPASLEGTTWAGTEGNQTVRFEFGRHGKVTVRVAVLLDVFVRPRGLGVVFGAETGFILSRDPDTVRGADAAFVSTARLPGGKVPDVRLRARHFLFLSQIFLLP
jgi:hypothetical protein